MLFNKLNNSFIIENLEVSLVNLSLIRKPLEQQVVTGGNVVVLVCIQAPDDVVLLVIEIQADEILLLVSRLGGRLLAEHVQNGRVDRNVADAYDDAA